MEVLFPKVERRLTEQGAVYLGIKREPLRRVRHFECEFPCRDGERLLQLRTRPGVFSHRRVDPGARALMAVMEPRSGERVLDIGCGSGVVGLAAAARAEDVRVLAIDSNARAIEATRWAAERNDLPLEALLDADGRSVAAGEFDLVVANPPYYSNFRIADLFVATATRALRTGGQLLVVTKQPDWYFERLQTDFRNLEALELKRYIVVRARRRVRSTST
jgi:16S rRNA (guanine1207-N2)-methyltransferase